MVKIYWGILFSLLLHFNIFASEISIQLSGSSKGFSLFRSGTKLLEVESLLFDFKAPDSVQVQNMTDEEISLLMYYPWINPRGTEETRQQTVPLHIRIAPNYVHIYADPAWARHVQVVLKDLGGAYYGLQETLCPNNHKSPNLRHATIDVEVNGEAYRYHENYASVYSAFYFNSKGYASFFDTFASGRYSLAREGKTILSHNTGKVDWYLFTGDYKTIFKDYYAVIGSPKFVPAWACGPVIWRDENTGSKEIIDDTKKFTDLKIPFTSIFVDRPYSNGKNGWSKMDFSPAFGDPDQWVGELNNHYGIEFMTWVTPATFGDPDFPGLLDGHFGYIDLTNKEGVTEFQNRLAKNQYKFGVKGHKLDRGDEHFPIAEKWADGTNVYERRNKYPYLYARVSDSLLHKTWGADNVNFARAAFHRSQSYLTAVWGGDVRTNWDGLASNMANAMRCGFMGFSNWGSDVGGYLGEGYISKELYARWLQFGLWTGFYEVKLDGAGGSGRERTPWQYDESFQKLYADIFSERMQLVPYIYAMLNSSEELGPLMKPMALVYPRDERFTDCWDQYLFGEAFLVAPLYTPGNTRDVILPQGDWYDYYTGKKFAGGDHIDVSKPMEAMPVFVKAGSIYAKGQVVTGNGKLWQTGEDYVDLFFAPGANCMFDFMESGSRSKTHITAQKLSDKKYSVSIPEQVLFKDLYIVGDTAVKSATKNGKRVKVKKGKESSMQYIENISGATLIIELN